MKYFVTGATGFIGGRLARRLVENGHEVVALARTPAKADDLAEAGVTLAQGDITDKDSMREPMTGVDGVFHVAAWYKVGARDSSMADAINIGGTRNMLELMQELEIPRGVYTSTLAVFSDTQGRMPDENYRFNGKHLSHYDRTKAAAHFEVAEPMMQNGLPLVIVMPGMVYGPGDTSDMHEVVAQYLQGKLPMVPSGWELTWAHVDDIVQGHILAMEKGKPGETYIIAGQRYAVTDFFDLAEQITGIPAPRLKVPPALMKIGSALIGVFGKVMPLPVNYSAEGLRVTAGTTYLGDNSKAKRELGYNPRTLEDGMREYLPDEMRRLGITPRR